MNNIYIDFSVDKFNIRKINRDKITTDNRNYIYFKFNFIDIWDGLNKTAVLSKDGLDTVNIPIEDNVCQIPNNFMADEGTITISVFGGDLRTINTAKVQIVKSGYQGGRPPLPPEPSSIYVQTPNNSVPFIRENDNKEFEYYARGQYNTIKSSSSGGSGEQGPPGPKGDTGAIGPQGNQGPAGTNGQGVPTGGAINQVLAKNSNNDFDTKWINQSSGGGIADVSSAGNYVRNQGSWVAAANVATTGNYNDLSNKPTIPAAQLNSDWNATSGIAQILNKPSTFAPPIASTTVLGGVKQGTNINIAPDGTISSTASGGTTNHSALNNLDYSNSGHTGFQVALTTQQLNNLAAVPNKLDATAQATDSAKLGGSLPSAFATSTQGSKADSAYQKPGSGIPKTDLASAVQTSLGKADTALQSVPIASSSVLGGVKVGSGLSVDMNGVLSSDGGSGGGTPDFVSGTIVGRTLPTGQVWATFNLTATNGKISWIDTDSITVPSTGVYTIGLTAITQNLDSRSIESGILINDVLRFISSQRAISPVPTPPKASSVSGTIYLNAGDIIKFQQKASSDVNVSDGYFTVVKEVGGSSGGSGTTDHAELDNLTFANSGHTGFQAALIAQSANNLMVAPTTAGGQPTAKPISDFATAVQGVKADTALQSVPNAGATTVGGFKYRWEAATKTGYITTDGTNP